MNSDDILIRQSVVSKILQVAEACVDTKRKGWFVKMPVFWGAMDDLGFTGNEVRATLAFLQARMFLIAFTDEEGQVTGISLVPQQYRCSNCNMLLDMQSDIRRHFDDCRKRQAKIKRNRELL